MKEIFSFIEHLVQLCTVFVSRILALRRKHTKGDDNHQKRSERRK